MLVRLLTCPPKNGSAFRVRAVAVADADASAETVAAKAAEIRYAIEAAARRSMHDADKSLSAVLIDMKVKLAIIEKLQASFARVSGRWSASNASRSCRSTGSASAPTAVANDLSDTLAKQFGAGGATPSKRPLDASYAARPKRCDCAVGLEPEGMIWYDICDISLKMHACLPGAARR